MTRLLSKAAFNASQSLLPVALFSLFTAATALAQDAAPGAGVAPGGGDASSTDTAPDAAPATDAAPAEGAAPVTEGTPTVQPGNPATGRVREGLSGEAKDYYAVGNEGKTLPERVMRVRLPLRFVTGDEGFDAKGEKQDLGLELNAFGTALVVEYGLTDLLSLQVLAPFVVQNKLGIDGNKFKQSNAYKSNFAQTKAQFAAGLQSAGLCGSATQCGALVDSGFEAPQAVPLPSGETVGAGVRFNALADSLVTEAATPVEGDTGLGDIEIGALYAVVAEGPLYFSAGGGLRFPTGSFTDVPRAQRATGRGTLDAAVRTNLDYEVTRALYLSWQHQAEFSLMKGKKKVQSLLDSNKMLDKELDFERKGMRNVGFIKAGYGLGHISQVLRAIGVSAQWKYDIDMPTYLDGKLQDQGPHPKTYSVQVGMGIDGLAYRIPLQVDIDYDMPIAGYNRAIAPTSLSVALKGYYRF